ncbi:MAG: ATP-binding cassette domain-containing protein [Candidatus Cloacimonetes bacterium]|jgi:ABC-type ATPase involved in cell division|nr:ATP-binding cassette domain-containing protein [Candidatus Cloacimonadota bacterium]MBT4333830.1 ATP-binding cassette domain-containing protein [Candidatus Cloacimonadota bacterium]MBT4575544.1 ATP-binding cassette domain-containing protein [Candidatus Cloacimonadota bacterium]MBT5421289.1 ATP-binding cassette domain-containing protein [Candidatus Cloacimonadota bacterium]
MLKIEGFSLSRENEKFMLINEMLIGSSMRVNIFGNNDTGRSLLLRSIHGDYFDYGGQIMIKDKSALFYKKKKKTILINNTSHLLVNESVWKNIIIPLPKITARQKQKIMELCVLAKLGDKIGLKVKTLSSSSKKFIELIRAVIQLPQIILVDDLENYFDDKNMITALEICNFALNSGTSVIATSKKKLDNFDVNYRIQDSKMVKL